MFCLSYLEKGKYAKIKKIYLEPSKEFKLNHFGLWKDSLISCKFKNGFGKTIAYQIGGCVFAIRKSDANKILVDYE